MPMSTDLAYSLVLNCTKQKNLEHGRPIQSLITQSGLDSVALIANHLIGLFTSCGSLFEANQAFNRILMPDMHSCKSIIGAHAKADDFKMAQQLYDAIYHGSMPTESTFSCILKACSSIIQGRLVHEKIIECGMQTHVAVGNTLVSMYAKFRSLEEAHDIFNNLPDRNVVTWSAMIAGYAQNGKSQDALECFENMYLSGKKPDRFTYSSILKACCFMDGKAQGRRIHEQVIERGFLRDIIVGNTLVHMYANSGSLDEARQVFEKLSDRNLVTWGVMITGYAEHGEGLCALQCFEDMQSKGTLPTKVTFLSSLKACNKIGAIEQGRCIHEQIMESGFRDNIMVGSTLVDMYAKCGSLNEAQRVFDRLTDRDVVSWSAMIAGYAEYGEGYAALCCFERMQGEGIQPSKSTFSSILKACSSVYAIEHGRSVHRQIIESGFKLDIAVGSSLVDMYAKCGSLEEARRAFDISLDRDVVSWGAIIEGYAEQGEGHLALKLFDKMQEGSIKANKVIFLSVLKACGSIGATDKGKQVHQQVEQLGFELNTIMGSALVDMYAKCGCLEEARKAFDKISNRDVVSWGAMIAGYAQLGEAGLAVQCFDNMQCHGIKPNDIVFTAMLTSISHTGLVEEGLRIFQNMRTCHGIKSNMLHSTCMVDLLGRAAYFSEMEELLKAIPRHDSCLWLTMLNACKIHCNVRLGRQCFNEIVRLDPFCAAAYVLMSVIYITARMERDAYMMEMLRRRMCLQIANNKVHWFRDVIN